MAAIFVEFNRKYKGKVPAELEPVVQQLKSKGTMRLSKGTARQIIDLGVGHWVSRNVGKKRESIKDQA